MRILALSGSLRAASINSALLRAAARLAPSDMELVIFQRLGELPLFNPDAINPDLVDFERQSSLPAAVAEFYQQIEAADAIIIASPEYAHGISGVMKNALDWLVSFEPFVNKHIAVINTSARAAHADAALREVLKTMSAVIVEPASLVIPLLSSGFSEQGMLDDAKITGLILRSLQALQEAAAGARLNSGASYPIA